MYSLQGQPPIEQKRAAAAAGPKACRRGSVPGVAQKRAERGVPPRTDSPLADTVTSMPRADL